MSTVILSSHSDHIVLLISKEACSNIVNEDVVDPLLVGIYLRDL